MVVDKITKELIEDWLKKLEKRVEKTIVNDYKGNDLLINIKAYISDTKHFLEKGDYVKAWELVSFAWGLWEAGENLNIFKNQDDSFLTNHTNRLS